VLEVHNARSLNEPTMLFDSTLRKDLSRTFGATLVVILTIVLTMMLIRTLGQAALGNVAPQDVILLMGYTTLSHLATMLALSLFIAVVTTLGRMYRESEMTIWFASGVRLSRFVRPVLRSSWPVLVVVVVLMLFVWPWVNQRSTELKERFARRSDLSRVAPGQFQTSADGGRTFFIERDAQDGRIGRNVFILATTPEAESVTSAHQGHIEFEGADRFLVLDRGQRNEQNQRTGEHTLARFGQYQVLAGERSVEKLPPKARPTRELLREATGPEQGELAWRLGLALGAVNLMLMGIGLSAANPRRASNWNMLLALLTFIVYFNLITLSQAWVAAGRMGLGTALLGIHGGALLLSLALLWWRDQGSVLPRLRIRREAAPAGSGA
jgi:lipopolysaccharide export system permease protein